MTTSPTLTPPIRERTDLDDIRERTVAELYDLARHWCPEREDVIRLGAKVLLPALDIDDAISLIAEAGMAYADAERIRFDAPGARAAADGYLSWLDVSMLTDAEQETAAWESADQNCRTILRSAARANDAAALRVTA